MKARYIIGILFLFPCIILFAQHDTLNQTDSAFHKQGYRKIYDAGHGRTGLVSEGYYINNRKTGKWIEYYNNGNIRNNLEFKNGRPEGVAIMYYENGNISETGSWINNRWTGIYASFHVTGRPKKIFVYDEIGKPQGHSISYYENGKIECEGEYITGKEKIVKCFYETGMLKELSLGDTIIKTFYENGSQKSMVQFTGNKHKLSEINYNKNGSISEEISYSNDQMNAIVLIL